MLIAIDASPCRPSTTDDAIFDNLQPKELLRYSQASRTTHDAVSSYIRRNFILQRVLGRYFSDNDILELRHMQYNTGALISGSTVLQFFDRSYYPESDLDIYVRFDCRRDIALWLEKKGYTMQPYAKNPGANLCDVLDEMTMQPSDDPFYPGSFIILEFLKNRGDIKSKIQLLLANDCPIASILRFHSSEYFSASRRSLQPVTIMIACVMNFIAYDRAYSLYPKGTFITRQSLVTKLVMLHFNECQLAFNKYKARGWDVLWTADKLRSYANSPFRTELRRVGDSECWTIPILPKLDLPPNTLEGNTWTLNLRSSRGQSSEHTFFVISPPNSRFSFTAARTLLPYLRDKLKKGYSDADK